MLSAVLLNWKRPTNTIRIVRHLSTIDTIDDITVWDNASGSAPPEIVDHCRWISANNNHFTYGRYLAMENVKHDWVYTQDDDVQVHNIPGLIGIQKTQPNRIAANLADLPTGSRHWHCERQSPWTNLGWGSVFNRQWCKSAFDVWLEHYGHIPITFRKADRIFTVLHGRAVNGHNHVRGTESVIQILRDENGNLCDHDRNALYKMGDHYALTKQAVQMAMACDWNRPSVE